MISHKASIYFGHDPRRRVSRWSHCLLGLMCIVAFAICGDRAAATSYVRVFVLAPSTSKPLDTVEIHGADKPYFVHSFAIPYATLQSLAQNEAQKALASHKLGDTVKCLSACPDVTWKIELTPTITFVDKAAPVITAFGPAQANGVDIHLATKVHIVLNGSATIFATALGKDYIHNTPFTIDLLIQLEGATKLNLWPTIQPQIVPCDQSKVPVYICAKATLLQSNVELRDLHGAIIAAGGVLGSTVGAAITGDLFSGLVLAIAGAGPAEKAANQAVQDLVSDAVKDLLNIASQMATTVGSKYVGTESIKADAVRQKLLDMQIPGVNKSLQELSSAFGLTFDVQTTTAGDSLNVIVTPRFNGTGSATVYGRMRIPKNACTYVTGKSATMDMTIGTGLIEWNKDLAGKVGQSCAAIFSGGQARTNRYLGADPASAKAGGTPLMSWAPGSDLGFTGVLSDHSHGGGVPVAALSTRFVARSRPGDKFTPSGYYECSFTVSNLPPAGILEMALPASTFQQRLVDTYAESNKARHLTANLAGQHLLLDKNWHVENDGLVIGGEGKCLPPKTHLHSYGPSLEDQLKQALEGFDPRQCANCRINLQDGLVVIQNVDEVAQGNAALRNVLDSVRTGKPISTTGAAKPAIVH